MKAAWEGSICVYLMKRGERQTETDGAWRAVFTFIIQGGKKHISVCTHNIKSLQ